MRKAESSIHDVVATKAAMVVHVDGLDAQFQDLRSEVQKQATQEDTTALGLRLEAGNKRLVIFAGIVAPILTWLVQHFVK